jgi:hypothetical protein
MNSCLHVLLSTCTNCLHELMSTGTPVYMYIMCTCTSIYMDSSLHVPVFQSTCTSVYMYSFLHVLHLSDIPHILYSCSTSVKTPPILLSSPSSDSCRPNQIQLFNKIIGQDGRKENLDKSQAVASTLPILFP